jgi:hypothetical protein
MDGDAGRQSDVQELRRYLDDWSDDLDLLRQNRLLDEGALIRFANDSGIPASGVITGDPSDFNKRGWLPQDGAQQDGKPLFHPFRIYPLHRILEACRLNISPSSSLDRQSLPSFVVQVTEHFMPSVEQIGIEAKGWNRAADLAILMDPLYWPVVTGRNTHPAHIDDGDYQARLHRYREKTAELVRKLDLEEWRKLHEELRMRAAIIDDNGPLYLLLRLSKWERREKLKGSIAGALWIRHVAETLRRAFEGITKERWPEEDEAFGIWSPGGRTVSYGSERPLDDSLGSCPRLSFHFGLFTGSVVRWYVEGDTEYHAIRSVLSEPSKAGIELVNLRGNIANARDNIALKLSDGLAEDCALRRFSMISFDTDVAANLKAIRRHVKQGHIVGYIAAHRPDFEFANFTLDELIEISTGIEIAHGFSGGAIREGDWTGVTCAHAFERRFLELAKSRAGSLKGADWGRALGAYAIQHPRRADDGSERLYWREIRAALQGRIAHYDYQKEHFRFDPDTFAAVPS